MKISIVTVCKNSEKTIKKTIESVINQTYKNIEYIIIDGKSTDKTVDIIQEYIAQGEMIKLISERDSGIYDAMNKGIRLSTGVMIGLLNSGDYYEKGAIENVIRCIHPDKYLIIYGMTRVMENGEEEQIIMRSHNYLNKSMICHQSIFVSKAVYNEICMYDTKYQYVADYDFLLKMKNDSKIKFNPLYEIVVNYSTGGVSMSRKGRLEYAKIRKEYGFISNVVYIKEVLKIGIRK